MNCPSQIICSVIRTLIVFAVTPFTELCVPIAKCVSAEFSSTSNSTPVRNPMHKSENVSNAIEIQKTSSSTLLSPIPSATVSSKTAIRACDPSHCSQRCPLSKTTHSATTTSTTTANEPPSSSLSNNPFNIPSNNHVRHSTPNSTSQTHKNPVHTTTYTHIQFQIFSPTNKPHPPSLMQRPSTSLALSYPPKSPTHQHMNTRKRAMLPALPRPPPDDWR